jgi:capsular polysaccharide biosynthesis protein
VRFAHYNDYLIRHAPGVEIARTGGNHFTLRPAPRLQFGPAPAQFSRWYFTDAGMVEVGLLRLDNVRVFQDRYLMRDDGGINVPQCGFNNPPEDQEADARLAAPITIKRELAGEYVLLLGQAFAMHGHWLIDFLPRLYNLVTLGYDIGALKFLLPHNLSEPHQQWLEMLGVRRDNMVFYDVVTDCCRVERVLLPFGLRGNSRVHPLMHQALGWMRLRVLGADMPARTDRRLFVSRRAWRNTSRILVNEAALEAIAASRGFEVVSPEMLPLRDQAMLHAEASVLVGDYGSALHNSIFAPPGAFVLAIRGNMGHPGFLQSGLCEIMHQDCGYLFCPTEGDEYRQQRYSASVEDYNTCLDLMLNLPR